MPEDTAKSLNLPGVRILSTIERHNAFPDDPMQVRGGWALDVDELWSMAGLKPTDVDFAETYDDYPIISMMQLEDLGFCKKGEAPDFVRSHSFTNDGTFPHNTSGGQLSVGQAGAAGGFLGLVEAMRQLTGETLGTKVPDAEACLVSGFGMINYDRGLSSCAAILASPRTEPPSAPSEKSAQADTLPLAPQAFAAAPRMGLPGRGGGGRFALQVCLDCGTIIYPPRCLPVLPVGATAVPRHRPSGTLVAKRRWTSTDPYFASARPGSAP